jgi:Spy/CpxP family protein refolding chaperone
MSVSRCLRPHLLVIAALLGLGATGVAVSQRGGGGGGGQHPGGQLPGSYGNNMPGSPSGGPYGNHMPPPNGSGDRSGSPSTMRGGLQFGPPGRWWDDKHFAKSLRLRPEQQRRMDGIFEQSRSTLLKRYEDLQTEEQHMETLTHASTLDENALFSQIDRVAQARADLEKANTHLLYQIRNEMDPDQITRLEQYR